MSAAALLLLLLLYCCYTAAILLLLLLYCCYTAATTSTAAIPLLYCCYYCYTAAILLLLPYIHLYIHPLLHSIHRPPPHITPTFQLTRFKQHRSSHITICSQLRLKALTASTALCWHPLIYASTTMTNLIELSADVWCALVPSCSYTTIAQLTATCGRFHSLIFQNPTILTTLLHQHFRLTVSQQQIVASNRMSPTEVVHRLVPPLGAVEHSVLMDHHPIPRLHLSLLIESLLHSPHSNHRLSQLHSLRHAALQSGWWSTYYSTPPRSLSLHSLAVSDFSFWLANAFHSSHFPFNTQSSAFASIYSRFEVAASALCARSLFVGAAWLDNRCYAVGYYFGLAEYTQQIGERVDRAGERERFIQAYSDTSVITCQQRMRLPDVDWERLPVITWEVKGESAAATGEERIGYYSSLLEFLTAINSRGFLQWHDEQFLPSLDSKLVGEAEEGEEEKSSGRSRYMHARRRRVALKLETLT